MPEFPWFVDINGIVPADYVEEKYKDISDGAIAAYLTKSTGVSVSSNAVRKFRKRQDWMKDRVVVDDWDADYVPVQEHEGLNSRVVESRTEGAIKTLDQLLVESEVDLETWMVDHYIVNKWPVGAKAEQKDITWKNGRIVDGYVRSDGLTIAQLWQVKAWLIRKKLIPVFPTIQPIQCDVSYDTPALPKPKGGLCRTLIWSDPQFGYVKDIYGKLSPLHNEAVLDIILQVYVDSGADRMDMLGDIFDLSDATDRFLQMPEYKDLLQPAIISAHSWFAKFREVNPNATIHAHEGNHDLRWRTATIKHLRAAYDLRAANALHLPPALSLPSLIALPELGIEWVGNYPDDEDWLNDELRLSHGKLARNSPGATARATLDSSDVNDIFGHIHRTEIATKTVHRRDGARSTRAIAVGCACHVDGRVPSAGVQMNWDNSFAIVDYDPNGIYFNVTTIFVVDNCAVYNGKLYKGRGDENSSRFG